MCNSPQQDFETDVTDAYGSDHLERREKHQCDVCKRKFPLLQTLRRHVKMSHKAHSCSICKRNFSNKKDLKKHSSTHKILEEGLSASVPGNNSLKCDRCVFSCNDYEQLKVHLRTVHRVKFKVCEDCNQEFRTEKDLRLHCKESHQKDLYTCSICGQSLPSSYAKKSHEKNHEESDEAANSDSPLKCSHCNIISADVHAKSMHLLQHHGIYAYKCEDCGEGFTGEESYGRHCFRVHEKRLYQCPHCSHLFISSKFLRKHAKLHESDYASPIQKEDSLECNYCDYKAPKTGTLSLHLRERHGVESYVCKWCNETFSNVSDFETHCRDIHRKRPFRCSKCNAGFTYRRTLVAHLKRHEELDEQENLLGNLQGDLQESSNREPENPLRCTRCDFVGANEEARKLHYSWAHDFIVLFCEECELDFDREQDYIDHFGNIHNMNGFPCCFCDKRFKTRKSKRFHESKH